MYGTCGRIDNKADFDFDFDFDHSFPEHLLISDLVSNSFSALNLKKSNILLITDKFVTEV